MHELDGSLSPSWLTEHGLKKKNVAVRSNYFDQFQGGELKLTKY